MLIHPRLAIFKAVSGSRQKMVVRLSFMEMKVILSVMMEESMRQMVFWSWSEVYLPLAGIPKSGILRTGALKASFVAVPQSIRFVVLVVNSTWLTSP